MSILWRIVTAITSAAKGWSCTWLLLLAMLIYNFVRYGPRTISDDLTIYAFWPIATAIVTLIATAVLIVPYVCLVSPASLLRRPWRIYVESALLIVIPTSLAIYTGDIGGPKNFLGSCIAFALTTSMASSAFYMRQLKKKRTLAALQLDESDLDGA